MKTIEKVTYSIIDQLNKEYSETQDIFFKIHKDDNTKMYIVHRAIKQQLNNRRQGNANTKTRSEIRGGGKKPWKQKGTGKARAGSTRSPLWRGGGVIFGPKTKTYNSKINKKEKILALNILLHNKQKNTKIVKNLFANIDEPSTKKMLLTLKQLGLCIDTKEKLLIILNNKNKVTYLSTRNLQNIEIIEAKHLNSLSLIKANQILITDEALKTIKQNNNE